jgi:ATP-dependent DNA ligase
MAILPTLECASMPLAGRRFQASGKPNRHCCDFCQSKSDLAWHLKLPIQAEPMDLPVNPPVLPMLAKRVAELPRGDGFIFEPKWDGFRGIGVRDTHLATREQ